MMMMMMMVDPICGYCAPSFRQVAPTDRIGSSQERSDRGKCNLPNRSGSDDVIDFSQ